MKCCWCEWECLPKQGVKEFLTPHGETTIATEYLECINCKEYFCTTSQMESIRETMKEEISSC